jgi:hypothetical protein
MHVKAERAFGSRASGLFRRPALVIELAADLEECRVEEMLERTGHVAEVRSRAEDVTVGRKHVVGGRFERGPDDELDPLDERISRTRDDGLGEHVHRT